ncbi:MAG TPA: carboxypeptidase-like regulatory domain-containing protein [Candidatus Aquilonibacter sp.]|nr:carboxypeptidase-like regulatory domain-containing protein [Candidatus Aquilonibacter sp.]
MRLHRRLLPCFLSITFFVALTCGVSSAQGSYRAQLRGVVSDASGAVVANATVTIRDVGTNIASTAHTDDKGSYFFTGLRPSTYAVRADAPGFRAAERTNVVLGVDQESSLNFRLQLAGVSSTVEVTTTAPLLDTGNASLGTDVTNKYVVELPLVNRDFFGLTFLAGGVTEAAGSGTQDNYPSGTNFVSNGQRNATAEIRLDGAPLSAPEQGEGGNSNVYYEPLVEGVQEFKVQNNSFSAEFGNNGGTVVNMVMKSGTNSFHGSAWYFLQRSELDARDFFNPAPNAKPQSARDQGGFSIGGPIRRNKTFFFADFEKVRSDTAFNGVATVPTAAERAGNFSATSTSIYDPTLPLVACASGLCRPQVPGNIIPRGEIDPIGKAILNLYPQQNLPGEINNYLFSGTAHAPDYQFDIKIDHQINDKNHLSARYSRGSSNYYTPMIFGDGFDNNGSGDGIAGSPTLAQNGSFEYSRTINPRIVWTSHFAIDRVHELETSGIPTISSFNASLPAGVQLSPIFEEANGIDRMPAIYMSSGGQTAPWTDLYDQCCVNTTFAHTLYTYSSQIVISKGSHLMKIGGEQRLFYNNFFQPSDPTGTLNFTDYVTSPTPNSDTDANGNPTGNPFASTLFGYADNVNPYPSEPTSLEVLPSVANKSAETGFYFQDDWKVSAKFTVNLGIRYEWSTPYDERYNRIQFSNFTAPSGTSINLANVLASAPAGTMSTLGAMQSVGLNFPSTEPVIGTTQFPTSSMRHVPVYRNDVGPRLGFAYSFDSKTVVRGGAGIYFGMSPATNFQYPGTAFSKTATMFFTNNNFTTQYATLENPFPSGFTGPQNKAYGQFADWGYANNNDLGTTAARDADLYMWNLGMERELPSQIVLGVDYSANRSTHLPWSGTNNRDFISSALLKKISAAVTPTDPTCQADSCVSNFLQTNVSNPFYPMFSTPCASTPTSPCFNEPNSAYAVPAIPLGYLLNPYPQFTGDFEGLMLEEASSWYNSMQIRFQKRTTHHISFEGNYTISKLTDNSSAGRNNWVGSLANGLPQQLDRLYLEHSIGANDAPQRLAAAVVVDLPIGRNDWIGGNMNRGLDAVIGGWSVATMITQQSGQPMAVGMSNPRLANGSQRPNVVCSQLKTGLSMKDVAMNWEQNGNAENNGTATTSFINSDCFADPGDQNPGNAPRYFPGLRVNGIHDIDLNLYKSFVPKEGMKIDLRAETFNLFNHPRFAQPDSAYGDPAFGTITSDANGYLPRYFQFGVRFEF